jgi:hypothetical protein
MIHIFLIKNANQIAFLALIDGTRSQGYLGNRLLAFRRHLLAEKSEPQSKMPSQKVLF